MKQQKPISLAILAACFGAPVGFRTANAAAETDVQPPAPASTPEAPEDHSMLGLLCKGAEVDPADVRWRVAAGLDPKQAVDAALAQKQENARVAGAAPVSKKGGK